VDFQPGDVVQLRSGGPQMTVESFGKDKNTQEDVVICTWFERVGNRQELHKEAFNPVTIQKWQFPKQIRVMRG